MKPGLITNTLTILTILAFASFTSPLLGQESTQYIQDQEYKEYKKEDAYKKKQLDFKEYIDTVNALKDAPLEERIKGLEQFLEDHPDTSYREEIKQNLNSLRALARAQNQEKLAKEVEDKKAYETFKDQTKTLPIPEQISRYEDFIKTNPDSSQLDVAKKDLQTLKNEQAAQVKVPAAKPDEAKTPVAPLTTPGETKDPNRALFMATVPGLFVPGMGSFYAGDTLTGVALVIIRLAGIGMSVAGIVRETNGLIITGALAAGFSYLIDIAAAPILVREHNEKLEKKEEEKKATRDIYPFIAIAGNKPVLGLSVNF